MSKLPPDRFDKAPPPVMRHTDGRLTLNYENAVAIGFNVNGKIISQAADAMDTGKPSLPASSLQDFIGMVGDVLELEDADKQIHQLSSALKTSRVEPESDPSYRTTLKGRMSALGAALETLRDVLELQIKSQGGFVEAIGPDGQSIIPPVAAHEDQEIDKNDRDLHTGQKLLEESAEDMAAHISRLRRDGITLPKRQADALTCAKQTLMAYYCGQIFDAVQSGDAKAMSELIHTATAMGQVAEFLASKLQITHKKTP